MKHGSLFTGIGGFDLAAEWVGWENIFQCEIDKFCNKLLKQNFPAVKKYGDIRETNFIPYENKIDVLSGGFPCQPYSTAGKRLGKEDTRHLWPEYYRAIREIKPPWVVGENVRGILNWNEGLVFNEVQSDLETEGYEIAPFLLPASALNAPHRRERIFIIAYSASFRREREFYKGKDLHREKQAFGEARPGYNEIITNSNSQLFRHGYNGESTLFENQIKADERGRAAIPNFNYWPTKPGICGRNDGLPNRVDRIKGLGNAVVPQLVKEIFETIDFYNLCYNK